MRMTQKYSIFGIFLCDGGCLESVGPTRQADDMCKVCFMIHICHHPILLDFCDVCV